jgi:hypothetical protein
MDFIPALNANVIATDAALAVEQSEGRNPSVVVLDLLEEDDACLSWHSGDPWTEPLAGSRPYGL